MKVKEIHVKSFEASGFKKNAFASHPMLISLKLQSTPTSKSSTKQGFINKSCLFIHDLF